jgi:DNA-binding transcriptional LysR family regulator
MMALLNYFVLMNTHDLKPFEEVALRGSFTKAAETMFTVQSNVTARIKNLEEEFGAALFIRGPRKVALTAAGHTLMKYSKQLGALIDDAKRQIQQTDSVKGLLRIGCIETTMALKAPDIITRFSSEYPDVDLEFTSAMRDKLLSDVLNYKLDAAFVSAPIDLPELQQHVVKEDELVIVASDRYKKIADILSLDLQRIIVFEQGCIFRSRLESWLAANGVVKYQNTTINSIEGIINFVEAGLGISILPAEVLSSYYSTRKIRTFAVKKELCKMVTLLVYRKDLPPSPALEAFVAMHSGLKA